MTQSPPRQPTAHPPYKQLRRPTTDRMVAGVASGIGRYFNVDPTLVRVLFAVAVLATGGLLLLAYPVVWFLMPEEPANAPAWPHPAAGPYPGGPDPTPGSYPPAGPTPPNWSKVADPPPAA
ncbi:PspC domain-containing protein [Polymorphospora sp. NPDC050346]|uniref:PspC domain-containing protein n=1 Tax=Polymorphospora sp. NPDC050346 TaxID=3155780 RepID=UPI0033D0C48F